MEPVISLSKIPLSSSQPPTGAPQPSVTLCVYLAAVATAVAAGMPKRSWVEATVAAAKWPVRPRAATRRPRRRIVGADHEGFPPHG